MLNVSLFFVDNDVLPSNFFNTDKFHQLIQFNRFISIDFSKIFKMPQRSSNKVKVYVRTRPTNNFAADMISIGRDNRVSFYHSIQKFVVFFYTLF